MCLAIPARITAVFDQQADAEVGGVVRTIGLWLTPEAKVGDYVYVHAGYAISVVDEEEAQESLSLLRQLAESHSAEELFDSRGDLLAREEPDQAW